MKATFITLLRVLLVFIIIALFQRGVTFNAIATFLIGCIIAMDALDGYIARRYGETSKQGAVFDILGDRIVENVLWIYFACIGEYSFWIPLIVITRDVIVDNIRSLAFAEGKTAFGETTMQREAWAKFLVSSNWSRGLYAAAKGVCFTYIGLMITLESANISEAWLSYLISIKFMLIYTTVAFCLVRGLPVVWEGREYLFGSGLKGTS
ncbi:MAG: CDP-alcohol phosphatidyltransferase family protein [Candidatus Brocadiales bacterium]